MEEEIRATVAKLNPQMRQLVSCADTLYGLYSMVEGVLSDSLVEALAQALNEVTAARDEIEGIGHDILDLLP